MMKKKREFDLVVYGASGFTGRLIAEYLTQRYAAGSELKWALAGRSADKIRQVIVAAGLPESLPVICADSSDGNALRAMAERTRVMNDRPATTRQS